MHNAQNIIMKIRASLEKTRVYIIVTLLLLAFASVSITAYSNYLITEKIKDNNSNFLYSAAEMLDNIFASFNEKSVLLVDSNTDEFYYLLDSDSLYNSNTTIATYRLYKNMSKSFVNKDIISDIFIYFKKPNLVLTKDGTFSYQYFINKYRVLSEWSENYLEDIMNKSYASVMTPLTYAYTTSEDGTSELYKEVIPLIINPLAPDKCDAVIVALIDSRSLNQYIDSLNTAKCSYLYIMNTETNTIMNQPDTTDYADMLNLTNLAYTNSKGEFVIRNDTNYTITYQKSSVNRLIYICVTPQLLITKQLKQFLVVTISITFVILLLYGVASGIFTIGLNRGLSEVAIRMSHVMAPGQVKNNIHVTGVKSLKNEVECICNQYETNQPYLLHSFLYRLLQNNITEEEVQIFSTNFGIFRNREYYQVFVIEVNAVKSKFEDCNESFNKKLEELNEKFNIYEYFIGLKENTRLLVLVSDKTKDGLLKKIAMLKEDYEYILDSYQEFFEMKAAYSNWFQDVMLLWKNYNQVLNILEFHNTSVMKEIYSLEDLMASQDYKISMSSKKSLTLAVKCGEEYRCEQLLCNIFDELRQHNVSFSQFRQNVLEMLFVLQEIMYSYAISFNSIFGIEEAVFWSEVNHILTTKRLVMLCQQSFLKLTAMLKVDASPVNNVDQVMLNYIDKHLAEVNLTMLADEIGMNQNYLSQYFKKHFQITFIDYVTHKKIKKAKELLLNTNHTCKAIGETLGFSDPNVFTRTFRKVEHITPSEYRRENLKL